MPARRKSTLLPADTGPPRRSTRIAAWVENNKTTAPLETGDVGRQPAPRNKTKSLRQARTRGKTGKPLPVTAQKTPQSKKQSVKPRTKKTGGTLLSRQALAQLERETRNSALPDHLSMYKVQIPSGPERAGEGTEDSVTTATKTTKYNFEALYQLKVRGVLPQQTPFERPHNYDDIRRAIEQQRTSAPPDESAYLTYWASVFISANNEQAIAKTPCEKLLGMQESFSQDHDISWDQLWQDHVPIVGSAEPLNMVKFSKAPKPDGAEGLMKDRVPVWIINDLGGLVTPGTLAFPNFILELKRDGSMYTAYAQNMHSGSTAAQAYHEYYSQIRGTPQESWDNAMVGSVQFNGSTVEGNVHWVTKIAGDGTRPQDRAYHMTRVMHNSTTGLGIEDFVKARREARNFRDYFCKVREDLLLDLRNHAERPASRPAPTVFPRNRSRSARTKSVILSEKSARVAQQRKVAQKRLRGGEKRKRGRPRKVATAEPAGVRKAGRAKSKLSNFELRIN